MRTHFRYAALLPLVLIVPLAVAGCYRSIGGDLKPTVVGQAIVQPPVENPISQPTATFPEAAPTIEEMTPLPTDLPTLTPFPTLGAETLTPTSATGLSEGQGGPVMEPTYFTLTAQVTATNVPPQVPIQPTFTSFPTNAPLIQPTFTPLPTATAIPPTFTPLPTYTLVPPSTTPYPTNVPLPTYTALRTPTPYFGPSQTFTPVPFITFAPSASYTPYGPLAYGAGVVTAPVESVPLAERPTEVVQQEFGVGGPVPTLTPYVVAVAPTFTPEIPTLTPLPTEPPAVAQAPTLNSQQVMATQIVYEATATTAAQFGLPAPPIPTTMMQPGQEQQPGVIVPTPFDQSGGGPVYIYITATPFGATSICNEHLVAPGETLSRIAQTYGVTVNQVAQSNNITNSDLIQAGDTLQIPCPVPLTPTPVVTPFTPDGTGGRAGVYIVQAGDNIYRISLQFNVSMAELMAANGITTTTMNTISVGQELIIPASATALLTPTPIAGQAGAPVYIVITATPTPFNQAVPQSGAAG